MDPLTAGIISAGANTVGGLLQQSNSRSNADHAFNQQLNASNTAHQREVTDLRAAGLNPILSALGSGASTPGATASESPNLGEGISTGITTGMAVKQANKEWELKDQTIDNMRDESFNIIETRKKIQSEIKTIQANGDLIRMQTKVASEMLPHALKKAKAEGDWSQVNQLMGVINAATSSAADISTIASPVKIKKGK